jgi:putative DNA primase/helicase
MIEETQNIRDLRQWLCWRIEERDGKPTKVPYSPLTGEKASTTNPETWAGYSEAVEAYREHGYGGIGFVFDEDDPFCGVDLDGCLNPEAGEIEGWAREIIEELDSYTEISPSGKGVHVLVRATLPEGRNRKGRFEAYDRGRYFTVTGKHLAGTPQTIEVRQEALESVVSRVFGEESTNGHTKPVAAPEPVDNGLSDSKVIQKALAASNGERFSRLWNGETEEYGSHSEADLALCGMLAFWTGGDAARIDTLFRQSGLYRKKWDRNDYRNRTIREALNGKTEFYEAPRSVKLADGTERKVEEKEERRNQADRLIGYALEDVQELFVDQHGAPHALIDGEPVPLTSRCYSWLRQLMWEEEGRSVSGEYLKMAAGTLSAQAEFSGVVRELHTRAAWHEGVLYYELRSGKVVRVGPGGWTFEAKPPVLFRRYPNLKPLPDPQAGGDLKRLWAYLNLKAERDRRLLLAYIATVPLPQIGRPILSASGPMGSGKTTAGRLVKRQWDPTTPETVRYDPRDFLQKASHCYIPMLDNLSALPDSASDTLCRLVTGEADSKRKLYTDDEDVIIELRRAVIINAINVPSDRGDVLDRSLVVELERIPDAKRITEEELWERFEAERPELLGALLGVLAKAIALKPSLQLSRRPRLADWGEYAAAVYEVMGWGAEQFLSDWDEIIKVQNRSTLDGSPVAQAIIKFMEERESFEGSSTELHKKLESIAEEIGVSIVRDKAWPKSARWLWRRIQEVVPLLVGVGIEASRERDEAGTTIALRRVPTNDASRDHKRVDKPDTAGNTEPDDARANARNTSNASADASRNFAETADSDSTDNTGNRFGTSWESDPMRHYGKGA